MSSRSPHGPPHTRTLTTIGPLRVLRRIYARTYGVDQAEPRTLRRKVGSGVSVTNGVRYEATRGRRRTYGDPTP